MICLCVHTSLVQEAPARLSQNPTWNLNLKLKCSICACKDACKGYKEQQTTAFFEACVHSDTVFSAALLHHLDVSNYIFLPQFFHLWNTDDLSCHLLMVFIFICTYLKYAYIFFLMLLLENLIQRCFDFILHTVLTISSISFTIFIKNFG